MKSGLTYNKSRIRQALAGILFWFHMDRLAFWAINARLLGTPLWKNTTITRLDADDVSISFGGGSAKEPPLDLSDPRIQ
jgi:hypothetical protein